jgi:hypothetical protein
MPGLGRKTFIATEVLTAADVNGYLMDQSVMKFAGTAARASAIGTAVSEGMVSYLSDSDTLEVYNGSAWGPVSAAASSGNAVINGGFDIWQRGAGSFNPSGGWVFTADRWRVIGVGSGFTRAVTRETFTPGAAPVAGYESQYFLKYNQSVAGTGDTANHLETQLEDVRQFAGQTVTVSFYAKAASSLTLTNIVLLQEFGSGGSSTVSTTLVNSPVIGTSWTRFTYTATLPSISGKTIGTSNFLALRFNFPFNTTFNFDIWGVQVEAGSTATAFKRNSPSLQAELAACQRYYFQTDSKNNFFYAGSAYSSTIFFMPIPLPVVMRTNAASLSVTATASDYRVQSGGSFITCSTVPTLETSIAQTAMIRLTVSSGLTAGYGGNGSGATNNAFFGLNAEL